MKYTIKTNELCGMNSSRFSHHIYAVECETKSEINSIETENGMWKLARKKIPRNEKYATEYWWGKKTFAHNDACIVLQLQLDQLDSMQSMLTIFITII